MYKTILFDLKDKIATITLNRPESGNAFINESYGEIRDAVMKCSEDENVAVVVITGTGKHFSTGGDISSFKTRLENGERIEFEDAFAAGRMSRAVRQCKKPVIAMINGAAAGAGCSLALACDFRVMTQKSKLIMAFINMALCGDTGGIYFLERLVGVGRMTNMIMTAEPLTGEEAYKLGVAKLAPEDGLEEATYALANKLASSPTYTLSVQKKLINDFFYADLDQFMVSESEGMSDTSYTDDFEEAVLAFLGKRKPQFKGR